MTDLLDEPSGLPPESRRLYPADWVMALMRMKSNKERHAAMEYVPDGMKDAVRNMVRFNLILHSNKKGK